MENERLEIVYLWINKTKYDCFSENEFNFSPYYSLAFDSANNTLTATKTNFINVFDNNSSITNITAIVGNNGVGKTTLLNYVLNLERAFNSKKRNNDNSFIICYLVDGRLRVENFTNSQIELHDVDNTLKRIAAYEPSQSSLLSSLSIAYVSIEPRTKASLDYTKRSSFITVTPKQINENKNQFFINKLFPIDNSVEYTIDTKKFDFESFIDIAYFANCKISEIRDKTISVSILGYQEIFKDNPATTYSSLNRLNVYPSLNSNDFITFYGPILGLLNNLLFEIEEIEGIKLFNNKEFPGTHDSNYWVDRIEYLVKGISHQGDSKRYFIDAMKEIKIAASIFGRSFNIEEDKKYGVISKNKYEENIPAQSLRRLVNRIIDSKKSFILKYLTFDLNKSDGELAYLNQLSYLYYLSLIERFSYQKNLKDSLVIMMDEIDVHMHPEWQRQLLNKLVRNINEMFGGKNVQIILSTHSPLVLSDFPPQNIIYISRKNDGTRQIERRMDRKTFGANMYSLYNDSFYFDGGVLIGDYAKRYIDNLYNEILSSKENIDKEYFSKKIDIIGEPILKKDLLSLIGERNSAKPNSYKNCDLLDELKGKMEELKTLISSLEKRTND